MNKIIKKKWVILSIIGIILIVIISIFLLNSKEKDVLKTYKIESTTSQKLSDALRNNEISIDEYVLYSAYSLYDNDKLDDKYKSKSEYNMAPDLYNLLENYKDQISEETKEYINDKIQMKNIMLGPKESEISLNNSNVVPISYENSVERRLDKHILSPNGKVIVWYTTNDTIDKTTDEIAHNVANTIESHIEKYSNEYGIEFKWEKGYFNGYDATTYKEFLYNIDSTNAETMYNAMPVYISAMDYDDSSAFYIGTSPNEHHSNRNDVSDYLTGIPVGPYINLNSRKNLTSDFNTINSIMAHELFHHYQKYICGEGKYLNCEDNINGDPLFIMETTAEWASMKITSNSMSFDNFIVNYLQNHNNPIDEVGAYFTANFLINYESVVDNGKQKILNGLLKKYHNGDTLKYLYEASDNKMPEVMRNLSKNNLINDYQYESAKGFKQANFSYLCSKTDDKCIKKKIENTNGNIKNMAMEYFGTYNNLKKYKISNLSNNDTSYINIFSLSDLKEFEGYSSLKISSFENQKVVYSEKFTKEVIVDLSEIDGEYIVISITNGHLTDEMSYKIEETSENTNITLNNYGDDRPNQIYDIYVDGKKYKINNFEQNNRTFVNIYEFCKETKICEASYTDNNYNKILVTSDFKANNKTYKYSLINEKQKEMFDSTINVGGVNFSLSQLSVDVSSCPQGKDSNGYDIPACNNKSFYVPIRFVAQALGYDVQWNEENKEKIYISSGLHEKLIKDNNIEIILSKDKVKIGDVVSNIIDLNREVILDRNETYYAYAIDNDNKRIYNSGFSLLMGNESNLKIKNELDTDKNLKTTYSSIETSNNISVASIAIITTITIPDETDNSKSGIYPIIKEKTINVR